MRPSLLRLFLRTAHLLNRPHIERVAQVGVSGERVARLAFDQNVDPLNARNVTPRVPQRIHGELLAENPGAVLVGKGGIQIDDGRVGID